MSVEVFDMTAVYYLIFLIMLTIMNVVGYLKIPILQLVSLLVVLFVAMDALSAFVGSETIPGMFIMMNAVLGVVGLARLRH